MSDQPSAPPKSKPGSLRDRIAAFEKSASSAPTPAVPPVRPKPAGFTTWKPKQPTPPSSPSAASASRVVSGPAAAPAGGATPEHASSSTKIGGMSASDAKESITKSGGGSLKERMAALQGKGAFGAPPVVSPKPAVEKPKWKPPPVVNAPVDDDDPGDSAAAAGDDHDSTDGPTPRPPPGKLATSTIAAAVGRTISPPGPVPVSVKKTSLDTNDHDNNGQTESSTTIAEAEPNEAGEGEEPAAPLDPEAEERQRRASIAARMARLGGARVGMAPPVFGKKPIPSRKPTREEPTASASPGSPIVADHGIVSSPPAAAEADSEERQSSEYFPTRKTSSSASILSTTSIDSQTANVPSKSPSSMPVPTVPRRAGPTRKKPSKPSAPVPEEPVGEPTEPEKAAVEPESAPLREPEPEKEHDVALEEPHAHESGHEEPESTVVNEEKLAESTHVEHEDKQEEHTVTSPTLPPAPPPTATIDVDEDEHGHEEHEHRILAEEEDEGSDYPEDEEEDEMGELSTSPSIPTVLSPPLPGPPLPSAATLSPILPQVQPIQRTDIEHEEKHKEANEEDTKADMNPFARIKQMGGVNPFALPSVTPLHKVTQKVDKEEEAEEAEHIHEEHGEEDSKAEPGHNFKNVDVYAQALESEQQSQLRQQIQRQQQSQREIHRDEESHREEYDNEQGEEEEEERASHFAPPVSPSRPILPPSPYLNKRADIIEANRRREEEEMRDEEQEEEEEEEEEEIDEAYDERLASSHLFVPPPSFRRYHHHLHKQGPRSDEDVLQDDDDDDVVENDSPALPVLQQSRYIPQHARAEMLKRQEEVVIPGEGHYSETESDHDGQALPIPPPPRLVPPSPTVAAGGQRPARSLPQTPSETQAQSQSQKGRQLSPSPGYLTPTVSVSSEEVLDEEEGDPIDPGFHSPSRRGSYSGNQSLSGESSPRLPPPPPPAAPPQAEPEQQDSEQSKRKTIAERMAKLGGIKFGAAPIPVPVSRPPPPAPREREEEQEPSEGDAAGAEGEEAVDPALALSEEEEEMARKTRISAKLATMGGMRIGMMPMGMGGFPPQRSHVLREETSQSASPAPVSAPPTPTRAIPPARPSMPPPPQPLSPIRTSMQQSQSQAAYRKDTDSEDGVKIEAEESEMEEIGYEEVEEPEEVEAVEEEAPPPVPSRFSRVNIKQDTAVDNSNNKVRPPVPKSSLPVRRSSSIVQTPRSTSFGETGSSGSPSQQQRKTSGSAVAPTYTEYVMVEEPKEESLSPSSPTPPALPPGRRLSRAPPSRSTPQVPQQAPPMVRGGGESISSQWELPSIPTSTLDFGSGMGGEDLDLSLSWTDAGAGMSSSHPLPAVPKKKRGSMAVTTAASSEKTMSADELMALWGRVGVQVCEVATTLFEKSKKTLIGDGTYAGFVTSVLAGVPNASPSGGAKSDYGYGYLVYMQNGASVQKRASEIMPGDIVEIHDARLKGHKGLQTYHQSVGDGNEPLVGVVGEVEAKKSKIRVFQANQHVGQQTVESVSYRLEDLKSGIVKVYRVMDA